MRKNIIDIVLFVIIFALCITLIIFFLSKVDENRKLQKLAYPPSQNWLEEDLELYLFSTVLDVKEYEIEDDWLFGIVREIGTERFYKFAYKLIKKPSIMTNIYEWKFSHLIEIKE